MSCSTSSTAARPIPTAGSTASANPRPPAAQPGGGAAGGGAAEGCAGPGAVRPGGARPRSWPRWRDRLQGLQAGGGGQFGGGGGDRRGQAAAGGLAQPAGGSGDADRAEQPAVPQYRR